MKGKSSRTEVVRASILPGVCDGSPNLDVEQKLVRASLPRVLPTSVGLPDMEVGLESTSFYASCIGLLICCDSSRRARALKNRSHVASQAIANEVRVSSRVQTERDFVALECV